MKDYSISAFDKFDKQWALVTAGVIGRYNTMTISWGGLGTLWNRPVATVYVRPSRYTFGFLEENERFTVSFFPPEYRKALSLLGSKSGRDGDKVALAGLTPRALDGGVTFEQASETLLCRKLFWQDMTRENIPADIADTHYAPDEAPHRLYIGEVLDVLR